MADAISKMNTQQARLNNEIATTLQKIVRAISSLAIVFSCSILTPDYCTASPLNPLIQVTPENIRQFSEPVPGSKIFCYQDGPLTAYGYFLSGTLTLRVEQKPAKIRRKLRNQIAAFKKQIQTLKAKRKSASKKKAAKLTTKIAQFNQKIYQTRLDQIGIIKCGNPIASPKMPKNPSPPAQAQALACPDLNLDGDFSAVDEALFVAQHNAGQLDFNGDGQFNESDLVAFWSATAQFQVAPESVCQLCAEAKETFFANECNDSNGNCGIASADPTALSLEVGPIALHQPNVKVPVVTFYIVSDGTKAARLELSPVNENTDAIATINVLDPSDNIIYWSHYKDAAGAPVAQTTGSGVEPMVPEAFALPKAGVYQVRVMSNMNVRALLKLSPDTKWGFSTQNGGFARSAWPAMPKEMYAWAPVHRHRDMRLVLTTTNNFVLPTIFDLTKNEQLNNSNLVVPTDDTLEGHIWRVTFPDNPWGFAAYGFPFILSPDQASAEAIQGSVERVNFGPLQGGFVAHKFQLELLKLLPEVLSRVGNASALLNVSEPGNNPACTNPESTEQIYKNTDLLGYYSGIVTTARWALLKNSLTDVPNQNVDPESVWAGAIGTGLLGAQVCSIDSDCSNGSVCTNGKCSLGFNQNSDRWDLLRSTTYQDFEDSSKTWPLYGGTSIRGAAPLCLALVATKSNPCNPWGPATSSSQIQYPEMLFRGVAAALLDVIALGEDMIPRGVGSDTDPYPGTLAFYVGNQLLPVYKVAAPYLESLAADNFCGESIGYRIKRFWSTAIRRVEDRTFNDYITSASNQSSHFLTAYEEFAIGSTGLPFKDFYHQRARQFAERFFSTAHPAGYFQEATGPDSSYTGMTHWHIGYYYGMTRSDGHGADDKAYEALSKSYNFFNHIAAPELDGRGVGSSNSNHRVATAFHLEQWGGARGIAEQIPDIARWSNEITADPASAAVSLASYAAGVEEMAPNAHKYALGTVPTKFMYLTINERAEPLPLPAEESQPFIRNIGNQIYAVKTPHYYTAIYVGKPAAGEYYISKKEQLRTPYAFENAPPEQGNSIDFLRVSPLLGGGMSLFWTPNYGNSILTANWDPTVHHGLIATQLSGSRYWESYFSTSFSFDESNKQLTINGQIEGTNTTYQRVYTFYNDHIAVYLKLTAISQQNLSKLVENIPLATCTRADCDSNQMVNRKRYGATIINGAGQAITGAHVLSQFGVQDNNNNGIMVNLDGPRAVNVYPNGLRHLYYSDELQIGRTEILLPNTLNPGQTHELVYEIWPE